MTGCRTRLSEWWRRRCSGDEGSITLVVIVMTVVMMGGIALVYDGSEALTGRQRAYDAASQAARAGADVVIPVPGGGTQLDPVAARTAALNYLSAIGLTGTVQVSAAIVTVTVTLSQPTTLAAVIGVRSWTVTGTASAQPLTGLRTEGGP